MTSFAGSALHDEAAPSGRALDEHGHSVLFYDADEFLLDRLSQYIGNALRGGGRALVVATAPHRAALDGRLQESSIDVQAAVKQQRYVAVDAAETLGRFMVGGAPSAREFERVAGELIRAARGQGELRIFGEMVALLAGSGNAEAALALEALWNVLQAKVRFSLLCAYPMHQFSEPASGPLLASTCGQHSYVIPAESYSSLSREADRLREIAALQQKAAALEHEVAERRLAEDRLEVALAAERAARDQAEAALRTREEFLSVASHELRTPITVLGAQAQLLLRRLRRSDQVDLERVAQGLQSVDAQATKLARLVEHLLDGSRVDSGKLRLEVRSTDLAQLVGQVVSAARALGGKHSISFTAPQSLECEVDPLRVEQVLTNLLDNAVKYSPGGGPIEVALCQPEPGLLELSVRDHGLGVEPAKRSHIFERFYQANDNGYRSGMGLGLYLCRHIVELHGGEIRAEFPADGGSRFVVQLPLVQAATSALSSATD